MKTDDERDVRYTKNNNTPHFNQISDEEKGYGAVDTTHAVSHSKTTSNETVWNIWLVTKRKELCFCDE